MARSSRLPLLEDRRNLLECWSVFFLGQAGGRRGFLLNRLASIARPFFLEHVMVCKIKPAKSVDCGLPVATWKELADGANPSPIHVTVDQGETRARWIKYIRRDESHKPEILIGVIGGEKFIYVWGPERWGEFVVLLYSQTKQDMPLTEDDVVALIKLRLENVR